MANLSFKSGSYSDISNLKSGDVGFAFFNEEDKGTIVVKDNSQLYKLMPDPGEASDIYKPLVSLGGASAPAYQTLSIAGGGTGNTEFVPNRLLFYNSDNDKLESSYNYVSSSQLGINAIEMPSSDVNFYVNGESRFSGLLKILNTSKASSSTTGALRVTGGVGIAKNLIVGTTLQTGGMATVNQLKISSTEEVGHLQFSRTGNPSYITAPDRVAFFIGTGTLSLNSCSLVAASNYIAPGKSGGSTLGSQAYVWKESYVENYRVYDFTNKNPGGQFYTTNSSSKISQPTYLEIGNNISEGTVGSRFGILRMYNKYSRYTDLKSKDNNLQNYTLYLPANNGELIYRVNTGDENTPVYNTGDELTPVYVDSNGQVNSVSSVGISAGGTGATTIEAARTNLGFTGAITSVITNDLDPNLVLISNSLGKISSSQVTNTELLYLKNTSGNIQSQINNINANKTQVQIITWEDSD